MVGRYRPDFISVCDVDFSKVEEQYRYYQNITNNNENYGPRNLFNTTICRASRKDLYEERKSFPSGHSSCNLYNKLLSIYLFICLFIYLLTINYIINNDIIIVSLFVDI